jgi:hypothetical protein
MLGWPVCQLSQFKKEMLSEFNAKPANGPTGQRAQPITM